MTSGTKNWLFGVWGSSGSDVYAVGSVGKYGAILHYEESTWPAGAPDSSATGAGSAPTGRSAAPTPAGANEPEYYVAALLGPASIDDTTVTATSQCFLCAPTTASKEVHFEDSTVIGLRVGMWGGAGYRELGFAAELSSLSAKSASGSGGEVSLEYTSLSLMPMFRIPFFKTDSLPTGRLNIYAGFALSVVMFGKITVNFPELSLPVSGDAEGNGAGVFIGASLRFSRLTLFAEIRSMSMNLSLSDESFNLGEADASINTQQAVFGAAYRF